MQYCIQRFVGHSNPLSVLLQVRARERGLPVRRGRAHLPEHRAGAARAGHGRCDQRCILIERALVFLILFLTTIHQYGIQFMNRATRKAHTMRRCLVRMVSESFFLGFTRRRVVGPAVHAETQLSPSDRRRKDALWISGA